MINTQLTGSGRKLGVHRRGEELVGGAALAGDGEAEAEGFEAPCCLVGKVCEQFNCNEVWLY